MTTFNQSVTVSQGESVSATQTKISAPINPGVGPTVAFPIESPIGYQHLEPTVATGLTVPTGAKSAIFSVWVATASMRDDGTNPTATNGLQLISGTKLLYASELSRVKFISATGHIDVLYYD